MLVRGVVALLLAIGAAAARAQAVLPNAPLPTQIALAKSVFISFGGADASLFPGWYSGTPDRVYSEFHFAMKAWGRYDLTLEPGTADLIMEYGRSSRRSAQAMNAVRCFR